MSAFDVVTLPEYGLFVAACADCVLRVFAIDGRTVHTLKGHGGSVKGVTVIVDDVIASVAVDGSVITWRANDGMMIDKFVLENEVCESIEVHGDALVVGTHVGNLFFITHLRGQRLKLRAAIDDEDEEEIERRQPISAIAAGAGLIVSCSLDGIASVWDGEELEQIGAVDFDAPVLCVALDDEHLVFGCANGTVYIHRIAGGARLGAIPFTDLIINDVRFVDVDTLVCAGVTGCVAFVNLREMRVIDRVVVQRGAPVLAAAPITRHRMAVAGAHGLMVACDFPEGIVADLYEGSLQVEQPLMDEAEEFADASEEYDETPEEYEEEIPETYVQAPPGDSLDADADLIVGEEEEVDPDDIRTNFDEESTTSVTPVEHKEPQTPVLEQSEELKEELPDKQEMRNTSGKETKTSQTIKHVTSFQRKARFFDSMAKEEENREQAAMPKKAVSSFHRNSQMFAKTESQKEVAVTKNSLPSKAQQTPKGRKVTNLEKVERATEERKPAARKTGLEPPLSPEQKVELFTAKHNPRKRFAPSKAMSSTFERKIDMFSKPDGNRGAVESEEYDPASMTTEIPSPQESVKEPSSPPNSSFDSHYLEKHTSANRPTWKPTSEATVNVKPNVTPSPIIEKAQTNSVGPISPLMFKKESRTLQQDSTNTLASSTPPLQPVVKSIGATFGQMAIEKSSMTERKAERLTPPVVESGRVDVAEPPKVRQQKTATPPPHQELETKPPSPRGVKYGGGFHVETAGEKSPSIHPNGNVQRSNINSAPALAVDKQAEEKLHSRELKANEDNSVRLAKSASRYITAPGTQKPTVHPSARNRTGAPLKGRKATDKPVKSPSVKEMARKLEKKAAEANKEKQEEKLGVELRRSQSNSAEVVAKRNRGIASANVQQDQSALKETEAGGAQPSQSNLPEMVAKYNRFSAPNGDQQNLSKPAEPTNDITQRSQSNLTEMVANRVHLYGPASTQHSSINTTEPSNNPAAQRSQSNLTEMVSNQGRPHRYFSVPLKSPEPSNNATQRSQPKMTEKVGSQGHSHGPSVVQQNDLKPLETTVNVPQQSQSNLPEIASNRAHMSVPEPKPRISIDEAVNTAGRLQIPTNAADSAPNRVRSNISDKKPPSLPRVEPTVNAGARRSPSQLTELNANRGRTGHSERKHPNHSPAGKPPRNPPKQRSHSDFTDVATTRAKANRPRKQRQISDFSETVDNNAERAQSNLTEIVASRARANVKDVPQRSRSRFGLSINGGGHRLQPNVLEKVNRWSASLRLSGNSSVPATPESSQSNEVPEKDKGGWRNSKRSATTHGVESEKEQHSSGSGWGNSQRSATTHGMESGNELGKEMGGNKNSVRGGAAVEGAKPPKDPAAKGERKDRPRKKTGGRANRVAQRQKQAQNGAVVRSRSGVIQYMRGQRVAKSRSDVVQFSQAQKKPEKTDGDNSDKSLGTGRKRKNTEEGRMVTGESDARSTADKLTFETLLQKFNNSFARRPPRGG